MIGFTEDELMLMMIYNPGTRKGLIRELDHHAAGAHRKRPKSA